MEKYYTSERHTQILIALMKKHSIRKIVASPGTTNLCFVGSLQQDPYFEIYSSVDERSAAFIACGMAAESGEPVVITCTGSTASRNYVPGLTEAYYRHLPIVAITASQHLGRAGSLYPQFIDRSQQMPDMVKESVQVESVYSDEDVWACELKINKAFIALKANGGGPVHINLVTTYSSDYSTKELPNVKDIHYYSFADKMPSLSKFKHIAILVGVHRKWDQGLLESIEEFCRKYNAVVLQNHASNYKGEYGVPFAIIRALAHFDNPLANADLVLYFGSVARYTSGMNNAEIWRVSPDGNIVDSEKKLTKVFQMEETWFFKYYCDNVDPNIQIVEAEDSYAKQWQNLYYEIVDKVKELPFSNVWIAKNLIGKLPDNCVLHIAGSNTARAWNFFELSKSITCFSNDGTMGIDGQVSSFIGESLASPDKLHFGAVGDLTFFYDMNSLGNRHIGNNIRLLIVNNGVGAEFKLYFHPAYEFGEQGNAYMAAAGHYGNKSPNLIKHYAEDLGFKYICATSKDEFKQILPVFVDDNMDQSIVLEVFTDAENENDAIYIMNHLMLSINGAVRESAKNTIKKIAGEKGVKNVKRLLGK